MPALGDSLVVTLKPVWTFAEFFLFTLTGCIIRPAIDQVRTAATPAGSAVGPLPLASHLPWP
jgi:hypothetical protein